MALLDGLQYLAPVKALAVCAFLHGEFVHLVESPSDAELGLIRQAYDGIEERGDHETIRSWLSSPGYAREDGWARQLMRVIDHLMEKGKLPHSARMAALLRALFEPPPYSEDRVPARFRHLCPWLEKIPTVWGDDTLIEMAEKLTPEEAGSLARLCEEMQRSGEIDAVYAWLDQSGYSAETARMNGFLLLCDQAVGLP